MRKVKVLSSFEKALNKLSDKERGKVKRSLQQLNAFLQTGVLPKGLGFKKLIHSLYEIRVDIRLRILVKFDGGTVYLVLVGSHSDIKKYLKRVR